MTGYLARLAARAAPAPFVLAPLPASPGTDAVDDPFERIEMDQPTPPPESSGAIRRAAVPLPAEHREFPASPARQAATAPPASGESPMPLPVERTAPVTPVPLHPVEHTGDAAIGPVVGLPAERPINERAPGFDEVVVEVAGAARQPSSPTPPTPEQAPPPHAAIEPLAIADAFFARLDPVAAAPVDGRADPPDARPIEPIATLSPADRPVEPVRDPPPGTTLVIGNLTVEVVGAAAAPTTTVAPVIQGARRGQSRATRTDLRRQPMARFGTRQG